MQWYPLVIRKFVSQNEHFLCCQDVFSCVKQKGKMNGYSFELNYCAPISRLVEIYCVDLLYKLWAALKTIQELD